MRAKFGSDPTAGSKILSFKFISRYQQSRCDEDKEEFREANKRAKREVAKANEIAYKDLNDKLDSRKGLKIIYNLSKTCERRTRYLTDIASLHQGKHWNYADG